MKAAHRTTPMLSIAYGHGMALRRSTPGVLGRRVTLILLDWMDMSRSSTAQLRLHFLSVVAFPGYDDAALKQHSQ